MSTSQDRDWIVASVISKRTNVPRLNGPLVELTWAMWPPNQTPGNFVRISPVQLRLSEGDVNFRIEGFDLWRPALKKQKNDRFVFEYIIL